MAEPTIADGEQTQFLMQPPPVVDRGQNDGISKIMDKVKSALAGKEQTQRKRRGSKAKEAQDKADVIRGIAGFLCAVLLFGCDAFLKPPYDQLEPTEDEADAIMLPVASIISRHWLPDMSENPDALDAIICLTAIALYARRARLTMQEIRIQYGTRIVDSGNGNSRTASQQHAGNAGYVSRDGASATAPVHENADQYDAGRFSQGDLEPNGQSSDPIADVLRRDAEGRRNLGI